jgi:hydrogenase-4 component F
MIFSGLVSMGVAAVFMARQRDFKRMLAYSSVEHMGILVLGVGIGGEATLGALLHLINNGMTKGVLFLCAGNIHRVYESKTTDEVSGVLRRLPATGALFLMGFFAITGSPPFGPFLSEFTILRGTIANGHFLIAGLFLLMLVIVFLGMGSTVLKVVQGEPSERASSGAGKDTFLTVAPIVAFIAIVLLLGLYLPHRLEGLLTDAAAWLEPS